MAWTPQSRWRYPVQWGAVDEDAAWLDFRRHLVFLAVVAPNISMAPSVRADFDVVWTPFFLPKQNETIVGGSYYVAPAAIKPLYT